MKYSHGFQRNHISLVRLQVYLLNVRLRYVALKHDQCTAVSDTLVYQLFVSSAS